jgi:hypothetical protein
VVPPSVATPRPLDDGRARRARKTRLIRSERFERYLLFIALTGLPLVVRSMKRRQFGALVATATLSVAGVSGAAADASAQETDPLRLEDATVEYGNVTASVGLAELTYQDGTMEFRGEDWTMEAAGTTDAASQSLALDAAQVTVDDVSAETYAAVRTGTVEAWEASSPSPLVDALAGADVDPDSSVEVVAGPVSSSDELVADEIRATGTVGGVVPEGSRELAENGGSLEGIAALGSSEWSQLTIQREDVEVVFDDVVMERDGGALSITSPSGAVDLSGRSLVLSDVEMNVYAPETIPEEHAEFASRLRESAADGTLTLSTAEAAAAETGVTVENTAEAVQNARFDLSIGEVTEGEETLVSNFQTSGTLEELAITLRQQL